MKKKLLLIVWFVGICLTAVASVPVVTWDKYSLIIDGRRVCPVMGEVHYSRIPAADMEIKSDGAARPVAKCG